MQRRAAICILGAFCISSAFSIETIVDHIPIHLHLQKLSGQLQLRAHSLSHNYILRSHLELRLSVSSILHQLSLNMLTGNQYLKIKRPIINMDNRFNEVLSFLILLIGNFLLVIILLTFFPIAFPLIFHPNKAVIISKLIFIHLMI